MSIDLSAPLCLCVHYIYIRLYIQSLIIILHKCMHFCLTIDTHTNIKLILFFVLSYLIMQNEQSNTCISYSISKYY